MVLFLDLRAAPQLVTEPLLCCGGVISSTKVSLLSICDFILGIIVLIDLLVLVFFHGLAIVDFLAAVIVVLFQRSVAFFVVVILFQVLTFAVLVVIVFLVRRNVTVTNVIFVRVESHRLDD